MTRTDPSINFNWTNGSPIYEIENDKEIRVSASMGAALYPDNGKALEILMNAADKALYQVKDKRSSFKIYNDGQYSWLKE